MTFSESRCFHSLAVGIMPTNEMLIAEQQKAKNIPHRMLNTFWRQLKSLHGRLQTIGVWICPIYLMIEAVYSRNQSEKFE